MIQNYIKLQLAFFVLLSFIFLSEMGCTEAKKKPVE